MQDEQLQSGAIGTDPNETVAEGQDLAVQDGPGDAEPAVERWTEDTKEEVAKTSSAE